MLSNEQNYVLFLLRKSLDLTADTGEIPADLQKTERYIAKNGILLTVYTALPDQLASRLRKGYYTCVKQSVSQEYEGERVLKALSGAGLDCMALKGWELKDLYPRSTMRQMVDLDILVKPYQYDRIKTVMEQLGYRGKTESSWKHDSFYKDEVHVEMHKRLTDDSRAIRAWEKAVWERAKRQEGHVYRMSPEDTCIFHFVHLHKDFMNGSLGLRRIVDTWLLDRQPVDWGFVEAKLEEFGMGRFHDRMVHLAKAAMGEAAMDEDTEFLLQHAFRHGIYGTEKSYKAGRIAAMGGSVRAGKVRSALAAVFLPYGRMKAQFPILEKHPILLPVCWIKRIMRFLRGNLKGSRERLDYSGITEKDYEHMKRFFEAGGVR